MKFNCLNCLIEYKDVIFFYGYLDVIKYVSFIVY